MVENLLYRSARAQTHRLILTIVTYVWKFSTSFVKQNLQKYIKIHRYFKCILLIKIYRTIHDKLYCFNVTVNVYHIIKPRTQFVVGYIPSSKKFHHTGTVMSSIAIFVAPIKWRDWYFASVSYTHLFCKLKEVTLEKDNNYK